MPATLYSHPVVFASSEAELVALILGGLGLVSIFGSIVTWYRHSRCSQSDCRNRLGLRRHGRYPHGHLKLCHVHHPHVPSDGQITVEHVQQTTRRLLGEKEGHDA